MLIKKLVLHNFRQFIGTQEIEFSTDKEKNVTVLIGINTSGKTTLIRAFEWILYNKNEFDDKILLNKNVAEGMSMGETQEVWGTLTIVHDKTEYEISRKQLYTCIGSSVRASVSEAQILYLQPDGQTKTKIGSDFASNIERILPRALSSYFFFGGERVGAISSREDIESSVKGLMGLDVLANAMTHLRSVIAKLKKSVDFAGNDEAKKYQDKLDVENERLAELEKDLANFKEQCEYYQGEKEKYAALLKANEETTSAQKRREQIDAVIAGYESSIEKSKKNLVAKFSRDSFAFFSLPLLKKAVEMLDANSEDTESVPEMSAPAIDYLLHRGVCICGTCISEGSAAERHLLAERSKLPPESIGTLVRRYREQALDYITLSDTYFDSIEGTIASIRNDQRNLGFTIDERTALDERLKNSQDVASIENNYQNACTKLRHFDNEKATVTESIGACKRQIGEHEKRINMFIKSVEKNKKISTNIAYAQEVFNWVSDAYTSREITVRSRLEEKVNHNFGLMYHGTRTITIDEKYRVKYIDVTTEESDGLKAVKSFAFVSGLVELAKEAMKSANSDAADIGPQYYPLVMDAPFSNVDETHIRNISKILPAAAEQVIIAVMQKDWEHASEIMSQYVGKSYQIEKDTDLDGNEIDTSTHIR